MSNQLLATQGIKRAALAFTVAALLGAGSPVVATAAASNAGGADKPVSASHGDCKNTNGGAHNGYECPEAPSPI